VIFFREDFPLVPDEIGKEKSITLITVKTYWPLLQPTLGKRVKNLRMGSRNQELFTSSDILNNSKIGSRTQFKFAGR
jgi:hypothetical protein